MPIFFIQPEDNIELNIEVVDGKLQYTVTGNELNVDLSLWNKSVAPYFEARTESEYFQQRLNFVKEFPDSQISAFLLIGDFGEYGRFEPDTLIKYANYLSDHALSGFHGQLIKRRINDLVKVQRGMDLSGTSIDSLLSLSDHTGKYIVIDFWATWCRSCVLEIPELGAAFNKYGSKVHFISISVDKDQKKWENFVKKKEMNGEQVLDRKHIADEMGVTIYPSKFIIDKKGVVSHVYVGDHPDFFTDLEALLLEN